MKSEHTVRKEVIVIGGGAAGIMAAIAAAENGAKVTILEKNTRPGRKLLLTGNGKCNITHIDASMSDKMRTSVTYGQPTETPEQDIALIREAMQAWGYEQTLEKFHAMGLETVSKDGYVYPRTMHSASVLGILQLELTRLGVRVRTDTPVLDIIPQEDGRWKVAVEGWSYDCDAVILTTGSAAVPATGSNGDGTAMAERLGMTCHPSLPALTGLILSGSNIIDGAGERTTGRVTLETESHKVSDQGEIQWSAEGISGIVTMQLSGYASTALSRGEDVTVSADLFPDDTSEELLDRLKKAFERYPSGKCIDILAGFIPERMVAAFLKKAKIKTDASAKAVSSQQQEKLVSLMKNLNFRVTGTRGYDQCQVCTGGVSLSELKDISMESAKHPGLFLAGEVLDADGPCGGYNLQWAWTSGYLAGVSSAGGKI